MRPVPNERGFVERWRVRSHERGGGVGERIEGVVAPAVLGGGVTVVIITAIFFVLERVEGQRQRRERRIVRTHTD